MTEVKDFQGPTEGVLRTALSEAQSKAQDLHAEIRSLQHGDRRRVRQVPRAGARVEEFPCSSLDPALVIVPVYDDVIRPRPEKVVSKVRVVHHGERPAVQRYNSGSVLEGTELSAASNEQCTVSVIVAEHRIHFQALVGQRLELGKGER